MQGEAFRTRPEGQPQDVGRQDKVELEVAPSEIDAWNRFPVQSATPDGEFVVQAIETYNWRWRREPCSEEEMKAVRTAAKEVLERWATESKTDREKREMFLAKLRDAASLNDDPARESAVAAVLALINTPESDVQPKASELA